MLSILAVVLMLGIFAVQPWARTTQPLDMSQQRAAAVAEDMVMLAIDAASMCDGGTACTAGAVNVCAPGNTATTLSPGITSGILILSDGVGNTLAAWNGSPAYSDVTGQMVMPYLASKTTMNQISADWSPDSPAAAVGYWEGTKIDNEMSVGMTAVPTSVLTTPGIASIAPGTPVVLLTQGAVSGGSGSGWATSCP